MKQNELFNKCCENCDPKTIEEVWKQMDKKLERTELGKIKGWIARDYFPAKLHFLNENQEKMVCVGITVIGECNFPQSYFQR